MFSPYSVVLSEMHLSAPQKVVKNVKSLDFFQSLDSDYGILNS
jgi:hypothetical protein